MVITESSFTGVDASGRPVTEGIGFSSIRTWMNERPELKVILIEDASARGKKARIGKLFRELSYYNIVFKPDTWEGLVGAVANVINNPRTARQALDEYGISEYDDVKEFLKANPSILGEDESAGVVTSGVEKDGSVEVEEVEKIKEEEAGGVKTPESVNETTQEAVDDATMEERLEKSIKAFSSFNFGAAMAESVSDSEPLSEEGIGVVQKEDEPVSANASSGGFDFLSGFGGDSSYEVTEEFVEEEVTVSESAVEEVSSGFNFSAGFGMEESVGADEAAAETVEPVAETVVEENAFKMNRGFYASSPMYEREIPLGVDAGTGMGMGGRPMADVIPYRECSASYGESAGIPSMRGVVKNIIDRDSIVLELENSLEGVGMMLCEYRCIVRVRGVGKGRVVDGRYRSGNITFEAFVDYMVNSTTLMVDVFDFDCEEKRAFLEGKECNLIFTKL